MSCPLAPFTGLPFLVLKRGLCSNGACAQTGHVLKRGMRSYGIALELTLTQMRPVPAIAETWGETAQTVKPPRLPSAKQIRQRWHDSQDFKP